MLSHEKCKELKEAGFPIVESHPHYFTHEEYDQKYEYGVITHIVYTCKHCEEIRKYEESPMAPSLNFALGWDEGCPQNTVYVQPTLEELIEWVMGKMGNREEFRLRFKDCWEAGFAWWDVESSMDNFDGYEGPSPLEAIANLGIALHKHEMEQTKHRR